MCKFKDTDLGIKKLDFGVKRGAMAVYLTDGREVIVPISMFPDIKRLSRAEREDYRAGDPGAARRPARAEARLRRVSELRGGGGDPPAGACGDRRRRLYELRHDGAHAL